MLNIPHILNDHGVECYDGEEWVQFNCPFCGDTKRHMGWNKTERYFNCFKCKGHSVNETLSTITGVNGLALYDLFKKYDDGYRPPQQSKKEVPTTSVCTLPDGTMECGPRTITYLKRRKFNARTLIAKYGLKETQHNGNYPFRIIIPYFIDGELVSWTGRDYTGKSDKRYMQCPADLEKVHSKNILYNLDNCKNDFCVVVEGPADVWRLGDNACAVFGIAYKDTQVKLLADRFARIYIVFDKDEQAQKQAYKLSTALSLLGAKTFVLDVLGTAKDPGEMSDESARRAMGLIEEHAKTI